VKHRFAVKAGAFLFVFLLTAAGRWVSSAGEQFALVPVFTAGSFGLLAAGIAVFTVDLVLAHSLLQRKILCIRILGIALIALALAVGICTFTLLAAVIALCLSATLVVLLFGFDTLRAGDPVFRFTGDDHPPGRYLRPRPLKTAAETLLRLFPNPVPVGLYRIGPADSGSPVHVTGNFDLTVRRVVRSLRSTVHPLGSWLLVCDSRGVNVWCSSMAGHFTTDSMVQAVERTSLAERVRSRRLTLPQLCASSVSLEELEERTGFSACFGPLDVRDLQAYRKNPSDPGIRRARFPLKARLEMALGCPLLLVVLLVFLYNFIGLHHLLVLIPLLYLASVVHGAVFPRRPVKPIVPWALLYGAAAFLAAGLLFRALAPSHLLLYALTVGVGAAYLVTEFSGWSPLLKYSLIPHGRPRVEVDVRTCIGCRRCVEVCPRAVFEMKSKHSVVVGEHRCVICRSCFSQCPTGAVRHSAATPCPGSALPAP
jgi:NAD-dependent dihydropyrimidine dehydrogenase PreA subunit